MSEAEVLPETLKKLFNHVDKNKHNYISTLKEAVAIQSVSTSVEKRNDVRKMVEWTSEKLKKLGAYTEIREIGDQKLPNGQVIKLPPVLIGEFPNDPKKKTILIYGHLDVQPANLEDGWDTEPFVLTEKDGKLYGRGSSDDKGPVLCWIHAIQGFQAIGEELPVNVKFLFEGMEESGSLGLNEIMVSEKDKFFSNVEHVCISDSYWLGTTKPCITYGLRGVSYFGIEVECASVDLHSGVYGGTVNEAMADLIYLLNTLTDDTGKILVKNMYKDVEPLTKEEEALYQHIEFDVPSFQQSAGLKSLIRKDKIGLLMNIWRYPSLSIHGIEGAFSEPGQKTVIPRKVIGKFSIRTVPNQEPEKIEKYMQEHFDYHWKLRNSSNIMKLHSMVHATPWTENPFHSNYKAGIKATKCVYGVEPDMTRGSGTIPITLMIKQSLDKNIILLPVGAGDDGAHSQNEKIDIRNYIEGTKLLGAYLYFNANDH